MYVPASSEADGAIIPEMNGTSQITVSKPDSQTVLRDEKEVMVLMEQG